MLAFISQQLVQYFSTVGATRQNALLNQLIKIKLRYDSYLTDVFIMPANARLKDVGAVSQM